jgi:hypothetical protein
MTLLIAWVLYGHYRLPLSWYALPGSCVACEQGISQLGSLLVNRRVVPQSLSFLGYKVHLSLEVITFTLGSTWLRCVANCYIP